MENKPNKSFSESFGAAVQQHQNDVFSTPDKLAGQGTKYINPSLVDSYTLQKDFNPSTFNPYDPGNYNRWVDKETIGSALAKGFNSFGYRFGNTFTDYYKDYGRMARAAINFDWNKMLPEESEMIDTYYKDKLDANKNFVFIPKEDENGLFNRRTMSEFIGNAGFMAGTSAAFFLELGADIGLTLLTGGAGAGSIAASASKLAGKTAAKQTAEEILEQGAKSAVKEGAEQGAKKSFGFGQFMSDVTKGFTKTGNESVEGIARAGTNKIDDTIEETAKLSKKSKPIINRTPVRDVLNDYAQMSGLNLVHVLKSKSLLEGSEKLLKGLPLLGTGIATGEKIAAGAKAGLRTGELIGMGLHGVRRVAQTLNFAGTEAAFEAISSYGETLDQMVNEYKIKHNGETPDAATFENMRDLAIKSSSSNYNTNMTILLASNQLQFGSLFNRFTPSNKFLKDIVAEEAEDILLVNTRKMGQKEYVKNFFGTYGLFGQIKKDFGKKTALYEIGKSFVKSTGKFEVIEGLQENLQDISSSTWRDYYAGQSNGQEASFSNSFDLAIKDEMSMKGVKSFLMGAFTGALMHGPMYVANKTMRALNNQAVAQQYKGDPNGNPVENVKKEIAAGVSFRNHIYDQIHKKKFDDIMFNFTAQIDAAQQQTASAIANNVYEFKNGTDNALLVGVLSANKSNMVKAYVSAIRDMGNNMSTEEFETAFNVKLSDTKYNSPVEFAEKVALDVEKYSKIVDKIRTDVVNMTDPLMYKKGSKGYITSAMLRSAQEKAVNIIALNALKATASATRLAQVSTDIMNIEELATSSDFALNTLSNGRSVAAEIGSIETELKLLNDQKTQITDGSIKKDIAEQIESKKKELELLNKWVSFWGKEDIKDNDGNVIGKQIGEFRGVAFNETVTAEDGTITPTGNLSYNLLHDDVVKTFTALMNIKNKQAGNDTVVSEASIQKGITSVVDYIQLDKDTRDYKDAVDSVFNPEKMSIMIERIADGEFKASLLEYMDSIFAHYVYLLHDIQTKLIEGNIEYDTADFDRLVKVLLDSEQYKNLVTVASSKNLGVQNSEYVAQLAKSLEDMIKVEFDAMNAKYFTPAAEAPVAEENLEIQPFTSVPISELKQANGQIGNQGIDTQKYNDLLQVIIKEMKIEIPEGVTDPTQIISIINADANAKVNVLDYIKQHPVTLIKDLQGKYTIQDGNHRVALLDALGLTTVPAIVRENTKANVAASEVPIATPQPVSQVKPDITDIETKLQEVENFVNQEYFADSELLSNHWKTKSDLFKNKIKQLRSLIQKGIKTGEDLRTLTILLNDIRGVLNEGININKRTPIITNEKNIQALANSLFSLISDTVIKDYIHVMNKAMESRHGSNAVEKMLISYSDGSGYTIDGKNVEYFLSKETKVESDIEAKKFDIEKRRQEELSPSGKNHKDSNRLVNWYFFLSNAMKGNIGAGAEIIINYSNIGDISLGSIPAAIPLNGKYPSIEDNSYKVNSKDGKIGLDLKSIDKFVNSVSYKDENGKITELWSRDKINAKYDAELAAINPEKEGIAHTKQQDNTNITYKPVGGKKPTVMNNFGQIVEVVEDVILETLSGQIQKEEIPFQEAITLINEIGITIEGATTIEDIFAYLEKNKGDRAKVVAYAKKHPLEISRDNGKNEIVGNRLLGGILYFSGALKARLELVTQDKSKVGVIPVSVNNGEPFEVENEDGVISIIDKNELVVNAEVDKSDIKVNTTTEDEAYTKVDSLNKSRHIVDFAINYLKTVEVPNMDSSALVIFVENLEQALDKYNSSHKKQKTINEFALTSNGKKVINTLLGKAVKLNTVINIYNQTTDKVQPEEIITSKDLNLESLTTKLNNELSEFKNNIADSEKITNFVSEEEAIANILNAIKDINNCI